jgi:hypothetical protein
MHFSASLLTCVHVRMIHIHKRIQEHKRELGHFGQRELTEIASQLQCKKFYVSGTKTGAEDGTILIKANIELLM